MASLSWDPEKGEEGRPEGAVCIPGLCRLVRPSLSSQRPRQQRPGRIRTCDAQFRNQCRTIFSVALQRRLSTSEVGILLPRHSVLEFSDILIPKRIPKAALGHTA